MTARPPSVPMIRFTQNNRAAVKETSPAETAMMKLITRAAMFTIS